MFVFQDRNVVEGNVLTLAEGMAVDSIQTSRQDFLQSGKSAEELEAVYIGGVPKGVCGGRVDGQELENEDTYTLTDWMDTVTEVMQEIWTIPQYMERLPVMKLPFDGVRRKCFRMTLEDLEHLPKEWEPLKNNHFLLHGYYEYHHLLLVYLCSRYGERYAIGVPGRYCFRNQYMAESFCFPEFAPLEPGNRRQGSFGYWYHYLSDGKLAGLN